LGLVKKIGFRLDRSGPLDESEGPDITPGRLITATGAKIQRFKKEVYSKTIKTHS